MADLHQAIGFFGDSGSGKTTLIERLIKRFEQDGLRVAAVKHAHHGFDIDRPGKDSYRFRAAGAAQVLIASERRWVLMGDEIAQDSADALRPGASAAAVEAARLSPLARQIARFDPCDLVLVEGYRGQAGIPFIQVRRRRDADPADPAGARRAVRAETVAGLVAVASDENLPDAERQGIPLLDLNDIEAIARFIAVRLKVDLC
jgi:molybdopterin-guanine dinucleotide biosynthesis protein B